jgi:hypothetical protein
MRPYRHGDPRPPGAERVVRLREQRELLQRRNQLLEELCALAQAPGPIFEEHRRLWRDSPRPWMT